MSENIDTAREGALNLTNNSQLLQEHWEQDYADTHTPFDSEQPDEWIAQLEKAGGIQGHVLDAGCGPGRTSLYLAAMGYKVTGVDISTQAIERAKQKSQQRGITANFLQGDICQLKEFDGAFQTVVDIGCFHSLFPEDRSRYAAALFRMCSPGANLFLRALSASNVGKGNHPSGKPVPAIRKDEILAAFSSHWIVDGMNERTIDLYLSENEKPAAKVWFAEFHRP